MNIQLEIRHNVSRRIDGKEANISSDHGFKFLYWECELQIYIKISTYLPYMQYLEHSNIIYWWNREWWRSTKVVSIISASVCYNLKTSRFEHKLNILSFYALKNEENLVLKVNGTSQNRNSVDRLYH